MPLPKDVARNLERLRSLISRLPPKTPTTGSVYPFENFIVDDDWTELTGSTQGSVNHTLEVAFGCLATTDGLPLELKSHGPDLLAVVDVLGTHITGSNGENPILIQWVSDLLKAVEIVLAKENISCDGNASVAKKRVRRNTEKQELLVQEAKEKGAIKRKRVEEAEQVQKAKARTEGEWPWDPEDLVDLPVEKKKTTGRPTIPLLDKLSIPCKSKKTDAECWRCAALGCWHSAAKPRSQPRVLPHSMECPYTDPDLLQQAARAAANLLLGAKIEALELATSVENPSQPSVKSLVAKEGQKQRSLIHNHNVLLVLCMHSIPPSLLKSPYWGRVVQHLDPKIDSTSAAHMATALIPAEAARVRQMSIALLKECTHLTLSFDGATTRRNQSIYTVHVTTPDTRQSHLLNGHSASGVSHTGAYLGEMLLKVIEELGAHTISAVTSDNAANARLAKEILACKYPHFIIFADICHQMNDTAKDICGLEIFSDSNKKLRGIIRFLCKSSFAKHHLTALQIIHGIVKAIQAVGKTRFLTYAYAIESVLPSINLIVDLVMTKVIKVNEGHPLFFLTQLSERRKFVDMITIQLALTQPFARAVKCLESSASTPADVCLHWLACQATLNDHFTNPTIRGNLFPMDSLETEDLISDVLSIVNGRFAEMIEGQDRRVYITTLFLNPVFLGSKIYTRKSLNPTATTICLPARVVEPAAATNEPPLPDADLRASLPVYMIAGGYLAELLANEVNSGRAQEVFRRFTSAQAIVQEFRYQYMNYVRQIAPFDRYLDEKTPREYWVKTSRHPDAGIIGYLGLSYTRSYRTHTCCSNPCDIITVTGLNNSDYITQNPAELKAAATNYYHEYYPVG